MVVSEWAGEVGGVGFCRQLGVVGWGFCYLLQLIALRLGAFFDKTEVWARKRGLDWEEGGLFSTSFREGSKGFSIADDRPLMSRRVNPEGYRFAGTLPGATGAVNPARAVFPWIGAVAC